jgi:hypothetical protein
VNKLRITTKLSYTNLHVLPNVDKIKLFSEKNFRQNRGDEYVVCYFYQILAKKVKNKIKYIALLMLVLEDHDSLLNKLIISGRRGKRRKKLLDDLKDRTGYCQMKEEALDRIVWRNRFGRSFGPIV